MKVKHTTTKQIARVPHPLPDGRPIVALWGLLFLVIFIFVAAEYLSRRSSKKQAEELERQEKERQKVAKENREHERKLEEMREREKLEKEKLRLQEIEQRRLREIEYKKRRSAKEATNDSLNDFL